VLYYERKLISEGYNLVIGVDEAGRGPLAGPVVACAVTLRKTAFKNRIDDSKKLSCRQREMAFEEIIRNSWFGFGIVSEKIIDSSNISVATQMAMQQAVSCLLRKVPGLSQLRGFIIVDGNMRLKFPLPYTSIIRGDGRSKTIASASILAKVMRDRIMSVYDRIYPQYGFIRHKGYPTVLHKQRIKEFGASFIHRMSFCAQ